MIKLLAVDMDGTGLDSQGNMSDKTYEALKRAAEKGIIVVPTTGRNMTILPTKIKNESFYRYVISSNGALVVDLKENKELFSAFIDRETSLAILKKLKKHLIFTAVHLNREFYVSGIILYIGVKKVLKGDAESLKLVRNLSRLVKRKDSTVEEFQLFYRNEKYRDIIKDIIAPHGDICAAFSKGYAELFHRDGTKGTALLRLASHLGINPDEIVCIGDEENDVSMFEVIGHPYAMGNAVDKLKSLAEKVLPTNDEDGVAFAINEILGE
ncbi:MAG: HAD family phosphatase [Clostridia bacterium]|nr:HAD family phosphatase [Clostridia bacterium]